MSALASSPQSVLSKGEAQAEVDRILDLVKPLSKLITAIGNFSVQYNFQSISIALLVMAASECTIDDDGCRDGEQAAWVLTTASAMVFVGAITGQLTMGYAGDVLGRNIAMTLTLSLVALGAFLSAVASHGSPSAVYIVIIIARFVLGIGAGGVYPLSATKAAEDGGSHGSVDIRSAAMAFFWQQPGAMAPWLLALLFTAIPGLTNDTIWRLLLGLGALPAAVVVLMTVREMRLKAQIKKIEVTVLGVSEVDSTNSHKNDDLLREMLSQWSTWKDLLATAGGWFIYDVAYYGVNLFGGEILSKIDETDDDNISSHHSLSHIAGMQLVGLSMGIPACLLSIWCLSYMSTRTLQVGGFLLIAFFFTLLAALFVPLRGSYSSLLFTIYVGLLFSLSFGPNLTTYILPAQTFPKKVRATLNGISAAAGKLGAFSGVYLFGSIVQVSTYPTVMAICAVLSVLGAWVSYAFITNPEALRIPTADAGGDLLHHDQSHQAHLDRLSDEGHAHTKGLLDDDHYARNSKF